MESANPSKPHDRIDLLEQWLNKELGSSFLLDPMLGDASFRRYFRVRTPAESFVAMDAPPPQENCKPFVLIARGLKTEGLDVPVIVSADEERGFLLLTDFGDLTYLKALNQTNANKLYSDALKTLAKLQQCRHIDGYTLPVFSADWMFREWAWHKEWFLEKLLGLTLNDQEAELDRCVDLIVKSATTQPQVLMHRDYHSANLMVIPDGVGILDFQDAFIGPVTYDLVSLLRDCYIDWPKEQVEQWALDYLTLLQSQGSLMTVSAQQFLRWFDWMGLERHLKALLTFARKHIRDGQSQYLHHIPRTLRYVIDVSQRYPELLALHQYMKTMVQPRMEQVLCVQ